MSLIKHMTLWIKLFKSIEIQVIKVVYKIWYIRNKERTFSIVINGSFNFCKTAKSKQSMKMCSIFVSGLKLQEKENLKSNKQD